MAKVKSSGSKANGSTFNFEAQLWAAADKMRGHLAPSEYKHAEHRPEDMNMAAGMPVSDPASIKTAVMHAPDRRSALRFKERCRLLRNADSFRQDLHPDLKADFILANPPFNMSDWGGEDLRQDVRWKFGMPPVNNANYAWIQHFIHHLSPVGVAGFVMAKTTRGAHSCSMKITKDVVN